MIRESIASGIVNAGRSIGRMAGLQLVVEVSDHSINLSMETPDKDKRAWDTDLYKSGNVFVSGYSNPVKVRVEQNPELETPNEAHVEKGTPDGQPDEDTDDAHAQLISSGRYREYMRQDLISQLLTPESRWNILVWAVIGIGVLQFLGIIATLWATGTFS